MRFSRNAGASRVPLREGDEEGTKARSFSVDTGARRDRGGGTKRLFYQSRIRGVAFKEGRRQINDNVFVRIR